MRFISAACVVAVLTANGVNAVATRRSESPAPLNNLAVADGKKYFGVAADTDEIANTTYAVNLRNKRLFGMPVILRI